MAEVPKEALAAALNTELDLFGILNDGSAELMHLALSAATPYIAAQALREAGADAVKPKLFGSTWVNKTLNIWLCARADKLEGRP